MKSSVREATMVMVSAFLLPIAVACSAKPSREGPATTSPPPGAAGELNPADFALPVDNQYFPLQPGTTYRHEGIKEGERAVDVFAVTDRTKTILGIPNTVVVDKLYVDGRLEEIAHDWYTQDVHGNVWYFGETIQEFDRRGNPIPQRERGGRAWTVPAPGSSCSLNPRWVMSSVPSTTGERPRTATVFRISRPR